MRLGCGSGNANNMLRPKPGPQLPVVDYKDSFHTPCLRSQAGAGAAEMFLHCSVALRASLFFVSHNPILYDADIKKVSKYHHVALSLFG